MIKALAGVSDRKRRHVPATARTLMFGLRFKPSQKTLLPIYFSIPHGLARRARECDFRPWGNPLGLLARLTGCPAA